MGDFINVGVAQVKMGKNPSILRTILGSCVGICIYDRFKKVGGMAHILLPTDQAQTQHPEKYAASAIPMLIKQLMREGATREYLSAKIVGGASMFKFKSSLAVGQIGQRNIDQSKEILEKLKISIVEEDVGGSAGRIIDFFLEDGRLKVKAAGQEKYLYKV